MGAEILDDAHLSLATPLDSMLSTKSKFKIKSFHSTAYTYARRATGGLTYVGGTSRTVTGLNSTTFTKNLMAGYKLVQKIPSTTDHRTYHYETRTVISIDSATSLTIDSPFTSKFGWGHNDPNQQAYYNYESCPSLTYENFDLRQENGIGLINSDGTNHVYDNVQYSKVTTDSVAAAGTSDNAAEFKKHLKVGFTITMDGITRTVTKIVDNTLLHVDRAFKTNVAFSKYSYRHTTRKTGDFHLHWKPATETGDYHQTVPAKDSQIHTHSLMATQTSDGTDIAASVRVGQGLQDKYLLYPPVCYNDGRCVPKTSHSLVGVESAEHNAKVLSSKQPHQQALLDMVSVDSGGTDNYFKDCKPVCSITMCSGVVPSRKCETRRVFQKVNSTHLKTELPFNDFVGSATQSHSARVRDVTGTGTVHAQSGYTVTGASKETKTKFNSEFASMWTVTVGCGGAICKGTACASDDQCKINGKTTGGKCSNNKCTGETVNVTSVASDTKLSTSQAFTHLYNKVDYTIGNIPGLGKITASQNSKIVDGNTHTRFLEQLKVGYTITANTQVKTVYAIASNKEMTIDSAFQTPGLTSPTSYKFSGKKGTGEVSVKTGATKILEGTLDVTQTQFQNELALGYLFMIGDDYKVVTKITSNTILEVDEAFTKTAGTKYTSNDYNYESCWLSLGNESNVIRDAQQSAYTNIRPSHTNTNIRVVVKTADDNVDLVVKRSARPTTSSYDYKSVRESNPWALTIPQGKITCPGGAARTAHSSKHPPNNCDSWFIGVRGDNRYPQKTGASEHDLWVYTEYDYPNFICSDADSGQGDDKCKWLGIQKNEDANMVTNDDSQAVMRLTPNSAQRVGSMHYSTKVHLHDGFETTFQFRMTGFTVGCNSVLYPSGFCGGGDGLSFVIQPLNDNQIGCAGSGLGYANVKAAKQGNDWARHRCTVVTAGSTSTCDQNDDGTFNQPCVVGALCQVTGASNGGCGTSGKCDFQDCNAGIKQALVVEFDTWNNLKLHDPKQGVSRWWINATEFVGYNDNHVAIFSSNSGFESDHALNEHFAATPSIPNLADGKNHTVKIKYWPAVSKFGWGVDGAWNRVNKKLRGAVHTNTIPTCGDCEDTNVNKYPAPDNCYACSHHNSAPGTLSVFIDNLQRPVLQTKIALRKASGPSTHGCYDSDRDRCVLDEMGNAYLGFTAATGGERAAGRDVAGTHSTSSGSNPVAVENAGHMLGAAQNHEILSWNFCNTIGCVPI